MSGMTTLSLVRPWGFERLPAWAWLALQALALWPHGRWAAARFADGSDDPLGLAALLVLLLAVLLLAPRQREAPRPPWLIASALLSAAATAALWSLPPLPAALLAALALGAALAAWLPAGTPRLPLAGLALLALPLLASLQFYAGYPLRLATAELSTWLLRAAGLAAERSGAAMTVGGQLVIVDAPCSGVQMAWLGYFCACCMALVVNLRDAALLRRLPLVAAIVFAGNVLRNSLLVALEARPQGLDERAHEAIGLAVLALVGAAVGAWVARGASRPSAAAPVYAAALGWMRRRDAHA